MPGLMVWTDRLTGGEGGPLGHNIDDFMWPYEGIGIEASPRRMLDTKALGYVYDTDPA